MHPAPPRRAGSPPTSHRVLSVAGTATPTPRSSTPPSRRWQRRPDRSEAPRRRGRAVLDGRQATGRVGLAHEKQLLTGRRSAQPDRRTTCRLPFGNPTGWPHPTTTPASSFQIPSLSVSPHTRRLCPCREGRPRRRTPSPRARLHVLMTTRGRSRLSHVPPLTSHGAFAAFEPRRPLRVPPRAEKQAGQPPDGADRSSYLAGRTWYSTAGVGPTVCSSPAPDCRRRDVSPRERPYSSEATLVVSFRTACPALPTF